jgi:hypothetical protein
MALETLGQTKQPIPLSLKRAQVYVYHVRRGMALIDKSSTLIMDIVELAFSDLDFMKELNNVMFMLLINFLG